VLDNYGGGPGRVAIHGRGGASLADPLGTARSHGCIRVANLDVQWLARSVAAGTPVRIRP
jgi:lipoprotein-anchoring transpeptidase ErfK/SrfK